MINKDELITVVNKFNGSVGYDISDWKVHRNFYAGESKNISFEELQKLSFEPGGDVLLKDFLEIRNSQAIKELLHFEPEPEYFYTEADVKRIMLSGSLDEFLDLLDFAPEAIIDIIKELSVNLPLNDVAKRDAIKEKFGFDVSRAIEIKNTKYDGGDDAEEFGRLQNKRRVEKKPAPTGRRYQPQTSKE